MWICSSRPAKQAGRSKIGREEHHGRAEHVQAARAEAELQRDRQALWARQAHRRTVLERRRRRRRRQVQPTERLRCPQRADRRESGHAGRHQEGRARIPPASVRGAADARVQRLHALLPQARHRLRRRRAARAPSQVRDPSRPAAAVRLEGGPAHDEQARGGVRVQRVLGHPGLLQDAPVRLLQGQDQGRAPLVLARRHIVLRRRARGVGDRQHVGDSDLRRAAAPEERQGPALRQGGGVRASTTTSADAARARST